MIQPLYEHQQRTVDHGLVTPVVFDTSDPGTGKTRAHIELYLQRAKAGHHVGRCLVVCPKSIMYPAWGRDIRRFAPHLTFAIADAADRFTPFEGTATFVIINHDGVKALIDRPELLDDFNSLIVDESTAFKHRTSERSKAIKKLSQHFYYRSLLTGTPYTNSITEIWHQALLLDEGERLGSRFWQFRSAVCAPTQTGPDPRMVSWQDKPGANEAVADLLSDISIRHLFDECLDIPENTHHTVSFRMGDEQSEVYQRAVTDAIIYLKDQEVSAIHAAALTTKLLQIASGAVYDNNRISKLIDESRYELIMQLIDERKHCLVAFNWAHQKERLEHHAHKNNFSFATIDGMTTQKNRNRIVEEYQAGLYRVLFAHPQTAAHGLTLVKGTTTIWASPTYNAEHYLQFNKRIHRAGQTQRTETLHICAENTLEGNVYERLNGKVERLGDLLSLLK